MKYYFRHKRSNTLSFQIKKKVLKLLSPIFTKQFGINDLFSKVSTICILIINNIENNKVVNLL